MEEGAQLNGSNLRCPAAALSKHTHFCETINSEPMMHEIKTDRQAQPAFLRNKSLGAHSKNHKCIMCDHNSVGQQQLIRPNWLVGSKHCNNAP